MPVGIANIGNTCYINTTIQCLAHCPSFVSGALRNHSETSTTFREVYALLAKCIGAADNTTTVVRPIGLLAAIAKEWRVHEPHDVHEFLMFLLDKLCTELGKAAGAPTHRRINTIVDAGMAHWYASNRKDMSFVKDLLFGQYMYEMNCSSCGKSMVSFEVFNTLSFPVQQVVRLEQCIGGLFNPEIVTDRLCDICKCKATSEKRTFVSRFPRILVVVLNKYNQAAGLADVPLELDMSTVSAFTSACKYKLVAFACHSGGSEWGHYWACVQSCDKWLKIDDEHLHEISDINAFANYCYLLFFERAEV
jgi:ubiquitin C-terminal hydrolase